MPPLTTLLVGIAVILSALVSVLGSSARRRAVTEGRARAADLCELTGVHEPRALQDIFGPPTMDGVYPVTMEQVRRARRPLARLLSDDTVDYACMGAAALAIVWSTPVTTLFLVIAASIQTVGWFLAGQLPKGTR